MGTMLRRRSFGVSALAALIAPAAISGCNQQRPSATPSINLRQECFPYAGFAGEIVAAYRYAQPAGIKLNVRPGSETIDPIKSVITKQDDIGVASADLVMQAVAAGAPLVVIGVVNDVGPTCLLTRQSSGIKSPADFRYKRVGILDGTNTEKIHPLMLRKAGISSKDCVGANIPREL